MIGMTEKLKKKTSKSVLWDNTKSTMKMDTSNLIFNLIQEVSLDGLQN